ncbi:MAG: caspase family protein [Pseudomonadota bacterium]
MRFGLIFVVALGLAPAASFAQERVALLIGNGGYDREELVLRNPGNDVRDVGAALDRLGFEVRAEEDLTRAGMQEALTWFRTAAVDAEVALIFYAGHAVQVGSENFLIGTDLSEVSVPSLQSASVTLSDLLAATEGLGAELTMVVLDACRDNPFAETGLGRAGLSPVSGGAGTLVAYATDPGNVAADGVGANSTFTAALLEHIETPALDVRLMFGRVRQDVVRASVGQQIPWVEEAVLGEHYLVSAPAALDPDDELVVWREAVKAHSVASYDGYLEAFPDGLYAIVAELRIDMLEGRAVVSPDLVEANVPQAAAALELVGYLVPSFGYPPSTDVRQAFARWQATQPSGARSFEALMGEGARKAAFIGTYTAGILRNDIQRFASVEESLRVATENLATAEADFADNPDAQPALERMRTQVAQIGEIKQGVAADLDASRTYYSDLIEVTDGYLSDYMAAELQPRFAASRGITRLSDRAMSDAQLFYEHLRLASDAPAGSYAWLGPLFEGL